jgi:transcriptional regulator with XRE-family HTH domain
MTLNWNEKLKQLRNEKGISQKQAAEQMQMSRTCYANYEQGTREPSFDALRRICDFYDISADYLIGRSDSY